MAKAVGIDIGSKSLKILEVEVTSGLYKITHFSNLDIPFGGKNADAEILIEPIKRIFREHRLDPNNVALSLPTQDSILREILVDFSHDEHIKKIIKYEAEKYLHSCTVEDVIIEYFKLQTLGENKTKVFLAAISKEIIARRIALLDQCNIDPLCVDLDIMAIACVARLTPQIAEKNNAILVDFGAASSKIAVLSHGELRHVRAVHVGTNEPEAANKPGISRHSDPELEDIDWDIESKLIISLPSAEGIQQDRIVLVKKEEEPEAKIVADQKKHENLLERISREIKRTMLNMDTEDEVELVAVTGGGSQVPGLLEYLEKSLHIPSLVLELPEKVQKGPNLPDDIGVNAPVAFGLALRLLDKSSKGLNFRKEEFAYTNRFELFKLPLAVGMTLLMLLLGVVAYYLHLRRGQVEKIYDELLARSETVCSRTFPGEVLEGSRFHKIYGLLEKLKAEAESRQGGGVPNLEDNFLRWQKIFREFAQIRNHHYIIITKFSLTQQEGLIEGEVDSDEALDRLKRVIAKIPEVDPDKTRIVFNEPNPSPRDPVLVRRYRFQIGFRQ